MLFELERVKNDFVVLNNRVLSSDVIAFSGLGSRVCKVWLEEGL